VYFDDVTLLTERDNETEISLLMYDAVTSPPCAAAWPLYQQGLDL